MAVDAPATADPVVRLELLRAAVAAMERGVPVPRHSAQYIAAALAAYLRTGGDLRSHFGLRSRRGGQHETPHALERARRCRRLLVELAGGLTGKPQTRARVIAGWLRAERPIPANVADAIEALRVLAPPASAGRIARILRDAESVRAARTLAAVLDTWARHPHHENPRRGD